MADQRRTFLELQTSVAFVVRGNYSNTSPIFVSEIKDALNEALLELTNRVRLLVTKRDTSVTLEDGVDVVALPEGTRKIVDGTVYFEDRKEYPVVYVPEQDFTTYGGRSLENQTGPPDVYTIVGYDAELNRMLVRVQPIPDADEDGKKLFMTVYKYPSPMSDDGDYPEIPEDLHRGLIHGAIVKRFAERMETLPYQSHLAAWERTMRDASKSSDLIIGRRDLIRASPDRYLRNRTYGLRNFNFDSP